MIGDGVLAALLRGEYFAPAQEGSVWQQAEVVSHLLFICNRL
jgi:hypothetical protein